MASHNTASEPFKRFNRSRNTISHQELAITIAEVNTGYDYHALKTANHDLTVGTKSLTVNFLTRHYLKSHLARDHRVALYLQMKPGLVEKVYKEMTSLIEEWLQVINDAFPPIRDHRTQYVWSNSALKIQEITEWLHNSGHLKYLHAIQSKHYLSLNPFLSKGDLTRQSVKNAKKWPWGNHETKLLLNLEAIAKRWWSDYKPDKPHSAPRNEDIDEWIKTRLDPSMSKNMRDAIITILRADTAPIGRRLKGTK